MKHSFIFSLFLMLISCSYSKKNANSLPNNDQDTSTTSINIAPTAPVEEEGEFKNEFDILMPDSYRDWENKNQVDNLTDNWVDLYKKGSDYFLGKASYTISRGMDDCSGDSTKTIESNNNTLIFLDNPDLTMGAVTTLPIPKNKIWPKEKITLSYNHYQYTLRAEGKILSKENCGKDGGDVFYNVENYKLFIATNKTSETLLLKETSFNNTFVELVFAGDIDRDGKLDFIFSAARDYEEERYILFLSSKATAGQIVKKVSEVSRQFDC
jgi:hypothetical protein